MNFGGWWIMRKSLLLLCFVIVLSFNCLADSRGQFPSSEIRGIKPVDVWPEKLLSFDEYKKSDLERLKKFSSRWSSFHPDINLDWLTLSTTASSTLGNAYRGANICDGNISTAWVEGVEGNGIGEWIKIEIEAGSWLEEITTTPFSIISIATIPGYGKSEKTWIENNRVKKLLVVIYTPPQAVPEENEWVVLRLNLRDENKFQVFTLPVDLMTSSIDEMKKTVWLKIEEVYKGTKYEDTCISEFVMSGGFSS
jgi:hypothetical protein